MLTSALTDLQSALHKSIATFAETFFGIWVITDIDTAETALAAAVAAAVVPVKDWFVGFMGS